MKLERFDKYKNQKRIAIAAFIGLLLTLGGVKLYKTFAVYEVKKEFNILRGRIPEFNKGDINFKFLLDGIESLNIPIKAEGKIYEGYKCNKEGVSVRWSNVEWAPTILGLTEKGTSCTLKFKTPTSVNISNLNIGDYISYTPSSTSYDISNTLTGMDTYSGSITNLVNIKNTGKQTIIPSELNLWRVIKKNDNGTIDVVSEYVSSTYVYFQGQTGYEKLVGSLNTIAKAYETSGITTGSRHMGYNGQTETVTISSTTTAPWTTNPNSSNSPNGSAREIAGGGDYGYMTDYNLVKTAVGSNLAYKPNTSTAAYYWLVSRRYYYGNETDWYYGGLYVRTEGIYRVGFYKYDYSGSNWVDWNFGAGVRPIVTLSSSLNVKESLREDGIVAWKVN